MAACRCFFQATYICTSPAVCCHVLQVASVYYPGLPSAPRYELVRELFTKGGAGGMLGFEVKGGVPVADAVLQVRQPKLWTSLCSSSTPMESV